MTMMNIQFVEHMAWCLAQEPDTIPYKLAIEVRALLARLKAAEAVCEVVAADLKRDRDNNNRLFGWSDAEWISSLGTGERQAIEALTAWRLAAGKEVKG